MGLLHLEVQEVGHGQGGETRGVGIDEEEEGIVGDQFSSQSDQLVHAVLQLPDLAAGASAVGGGVHDDAVVLVAAADLPLHEFLAVVHDVADGGLGKTAKLGVLLGLGHDALGGVHVDHGGTRVGGGHGGTSRIGEEVEHLDLTVGVLGLGLTDQAREPVPVGGLLGEQTRMLEAHGAQDEAKIVTVPDLPLGGEIVLDPGTAACVGTAVHSVGLSPQGGGGAVLPDDLGIGADEDILPPPLQALSVGGVDELVVFPVIGYPHKC